MIAHHPVFRNFSCWQGTVKTGYANDFLGVLTKTDYYPLPIPSMTSYPPFNEEYFEWIDLLEAVITAKSSFTMVELGAGWGRWLCRGVTALRQYDKALPYHLIGIEAEPTHFQWMGEHLVENGIDLTKCTLVQSAITKRDGMCNFLVGDPSECYGQHILIQGSRDGGQTNRLRFYSNYAISSVKAGCSYLLHFNFMPIIRFFLPFLKKMQGDGQQAKAISLRTLLRDVDSVDLIDSDIQGSEFDVFSALPKKDFAKIKRIHIGTHSPIVEAQLRRLFTKLGWRNIYDFPMRQTITTEYGEIYFQDGVQSWTNPKYDSGGR